MTTEEQDITKAVSAALASTAETVAQLQDAIVTVRGIEARWNWGVEQTPTRMVILARCHRADIVLSELINLITEADA